MRLALIVFFSLLLCSLCSVHSQQDKPNVLFISIDDLNNWVGFMENSPGVRTPNIDRLASEGVAFVNAHCAAPACNASRSAVMTGLYPSTTGVIGNKDDWRKMESTKDLVTLPDAFQAAGYKMLGGGKLYHAHSFREEALAGHLDPEPWDEYFPSKSQQMPKELEPEEWPLATDGSMYDGRFDWGAVEETDDEKMADRLVVDWAKEKLSEEHESPIFLGVGIYRPHQPWWVPQRYLDLHPLEEIVLPETYEKKIEKLPEEVRKRLNNDWHGWIVENGEWERAVQGYLASITYMDELVGELLDALENGPLAGNTIIVFWSDHGYHLGEYRHWEKFTVWNESTHVPLIWKDTREASDWQQGNEVNDVASLIDIYPTLLEICGIEHSEHSFEGVSLFDHLINPDLMTGREIFCINTPGDVAKITADRREITYTDGTVQVIKN